MPSQGQTSQSRRRRYPHGTASVDNTHMQRFHRLRIRRPTWSAHPAVRSGDQLTIGERAADRLRNTMGSWGFVFAALVFLAGWMLGNRNDGFDKYPFILLNLILSCLAALQGAILLIAAKRQDQITSELARHDYETNLETDQIVQAVHALTIDIHSRICEPRPTSKSDHATGGPPPTGTA